MYVVVQAVIKLYIYTRMFEGKPFQNNAVNDIFIMICLLYILVECNHFAQAREDIFGRSDVVESFRYRGTPHLF